MEFALEWLPESTREEVTREASSTSWQQWIASFLGIGLLYGAIFGLGAGLLDALRFRRFRAPISFGTVVHAWLIARNTVLYGGLGAMLYLISFISLATAQCALGGGPDIIGHLLPLLVLNAVVSGLLFGALFALRGTARTVRSEIKTLERLTWSWRRVLIGGTVVMAGFSLFASYRFFLDGFDHWLLIGLGVGWAWFPLGAALAGLTHGSVRRTVSPNQGIRLSLRNAVLGGFSVAIAVPLLGFAFYLLNGMAVVVILRAYYYTLEWTDISSAWSALTDYPMFVYVLAPFSLALGLLMAMNSYGGLDVIQHYILRAIVWRSGHAPRDYARFLDYAVKLVFLQQVGGGYIFIHRLLLEHFADRGPGVRSPVHVEARSITQPSG
jgi:hypothetical protein